MAWLLFWISCIGSVYSGAALLLSLNTGQDLVELRNSLLVDIRPEHPYRWSPQNVPKDFLWETSAAPPIVQEISARFDPGDGITDFQRILAISRKLGDRKPSGDATQSTTAKALKAILRSSDGYCADYTQVLSALALSAGIPIREWGMSFDGYSGVGHAFNEIYDSSRQEWIFVDTYMSFYVTDGSGAPLSVDEFRNHLIRRDYDGVVVVPISRDKFNFDTLAGAMDYYARGASSFFMTWGNNVISYDQNPFLRVARGFGRAIEQAVAILIGAQPRIVIPGTWVNRDGMARLEHLRWLLWTLLTSAVVLACTTLYLLLSRRGRLENVPPMSSTLRGQE